MACSSEQSSKSTPTVAGFKMVESGYSKRAKQQGHYALCRAAVTRHRNSISRTDNNCRLLRAESRVGDSSENAGSLTRSAQCCICRCRCYEVELSRVRDDLGHRSAISMHFIGLAIFVVISHRLNASLLCLLLPARWTYLLLPFMPCNRRVKSYTGVELH